MSKGKLTFTLPEEQEEFQTAINAQKYKDLVQDINEHIRRRLKYEEISGEAEKELLDLQAIINEISIAEGIEI